MQESFREQYRQGRLEDRKVTVEVPKAQQSFDFLEGANNPMMQVFLDYILFNHCRTEKTIQLSCSLQGVISSINPLILVVYSFCCVDTADEYVKERVSWKHHTSTFLQLLISHTVVLLSKAISCQSLYIIWSRQGQPDVSIHKSSLIRMTNHGLGSHPTLFPCSKPEQCGGLQTKVSQTNKISL